MKRKYLALITIVLILSSFLLASMLLREETEPMVTLLDGHSQSHYNTEGDIEVVHPSGNPKFSAIGQALTVKTTGEKYKLTQAIFYLRKEGSPTGHLKACLYSMTGTYGTNAKPYGSPLASSELVDIATLGTSYSPVAFNFVGGQQYQVLKDHKYCIVAQVNDGNLDSENYISVKASIGEQATHDGNICYYCNSAWYPQSAIDLCFMVYGEYVEAPPPPPEGEYGLKISSGSGGSTSPAEGTYSYEEPTNVEVTATADDEYSEFDYWTLDGVTYWNNPITVSVDRLNETRDLIAYFYSTGSPPPKYTVTIASDAYGHTNPVEGNHQMSEGSTCTVRGIGYEGYELDYWMLDGEKRGDNPTSFTVTGNHTITAYFRLIPPPSGKCEDVWISNITPTEVWHLHAGGFIRVAQKILVENKIICSVSVPLKKWQSAAISGTVYARIRRVSDDSIVETSETTVDASVLLYGYYTWYSFPFWSPLNEEVRISIEFSGNSNSVDVGFSDDLIIGNQSYYDSSWHEMPTYDMCIRIYEGKGACPILAVRVGGSKALLLTGKDKGKIAILL